MNRDIVYDRSCLQMNTPRVTPKGGIAQISAPQVWSSQTRGPMPCIVAGKRALPVPVDVETSQKKTTFDTLMLSRCSSARSWEVRFCAISSPGLFALPTHRRCAGMTGADVFEQDLVTKYFDLRRGVYITLIHVVFPLSCGSMYVLYQLI